MFVVNVKSPFLTDVRSIRVSLSHYIIVKYKGVIVCIIIIIYHACVSQSGKTMVAVGCSLFRFYCSLV
jgi:hypothetical protein